MTRRRILIGLVLAGALGGTAGPALAGDSGTRVCVVATNDRNHPGPSPLCVWVPVESAGR